MSSRSRKSTASKSKNIKLIAICIFVFIIGYYLLNHLSTIEKPPLGAIFNIILGCVLMAVSFLCVIILVRKTFFRKKSTTKSRNVFLKEQQRNSPANKI